MALQAIAYSSQLIPGITPVQIEMVVRDAAAYNDLVGVTGVLLHDGERFLQYLEGPEDGVTSAYARIINSTSHMEVMELGRGRVAARRFPYWSMRLIAVEQMDLRTAALSNWAGFAARRASDSAPLTGVEYVSRLVDPYLA